MAGAYADAWARAQNPAYNYAPDNNCTNFSSQSLFAGTYPMIIGVYNQNDINSWWYNSGFNPPNSVTWSYTPWFTYFQSTRDADFVDVYSLSDLRRGDLIVLDLTGPIPGQADGLVDHMRVVSGWQYASPFSSDYTDGINYSASYVYTLLTDANTNDRWHVQWNYNLTPSQDYAFIHVIH